MPFDSPSFRFSPRVYAALSIFIICVKKSPCMPFFSGTHESHSLRFARCMHQYVDKPRLHANYSLTELIFVIVAKLRNFVKSIRKLRLCYTREPAIPADTTRNPCLHRHRRSFLRLRSFRCRSCHNHHPCHRHYRNFRRCFFPLFPGASSAETGN